MYWNVAGRIGCVMNQSVEANGYEFFFESELLQPPMGPITHQVKVIRIYDRQDGNQKIYDHFEGCHTYTGKGEREAFEKSAASARDWAEKQR